MGEITHLDLIKTDVGIEHLRDMLEACNENN
jgi:hypothetical protein